MQQDSSTIGVSVKEQPTRSLFGLTLSSDFPFANRMAIGSDGPDLFFDLVDEPPYSEGWTHLTPTYASPIRNRSGESVAKFYQLTHCAVLSITDSADFCFFPNHIICHHRTMPDIRHIVEIHLLGTALSYFLERNKVPMLHASSVVGDGRAIAFLSGNKGGKSSLAADFMQAGYPLLTDDILPVEQVDGRFMGRPGYPTMRMWPGEAEHFLGHYETLDIVHPALSKRRVPVGPDSFGTFCPDPQPLAAIYVPERRDSADWGGRIELEPVTPADAMIELVRHSFIARMVQALGWQPQRLTFFAELLRQIPVRRLIFPGGYEHLPRVRDALLNDL